MTDREYLMELKAFIENTQQVMEYWNDAHRSVEQIIADGDMPDVYDETLRRIAELES